MTDTHTTDDNDYVFSVARIAGRDHDSPGLRIRAHGLNMELFCHNDMIQLRKCPTGILVAEKMCPLKPGTQTIMECLDIRCALLDGSIPVPDGRR